MRPHLDDRTELSTLYPKAKPINQNPISTPEEIAERKQKAFEQQVRQLRRLAVQVGVYVSLPYIVGLFAIQQVVSRIAYIAPDDIGGAMSIVFASFLTTTTAVFLTYFLFKRTGDVFNAHTLKAWPVIVTILTSIISFTPRALDLTQALTAGILAYIASLGLIVLVGVVVSAVSIFLWTSKLPIPIKLLLLALIIALSLAALLM